MKKDKAIRMSLIVLLVFSGAVVIKEAYDFINPTDLVCEGITIVQKETTTDSGTRDDSNFIQASHVSFEYSCGNEGLVVPDAFCSNSYYGSSNQPTMFTGNTIIYIPYDDATDREKLREGNFVRYIPKNGNPTVHRISALYSSYLRVQGDNNAIDEKIEYKDITDVSIGVLNT